MSAATASWIFMGIEPSWAWNKGASHSPLPRRICKKALIVVLASAEDF